MVATICARPVTRIFLVVLFVLTFLPTSTVQAYRSLPNNPVYPKLPGAATSLWVFYDHLNSGLNISNSGTPAVHAINQWSLVSYYTMFDILSAGPINQTTSTIRAVNFQSGYTTSCGNLNALLPDIPGAACPVDRNVFLNSNIGFKWNTAGTMSYTQFYDASCSCNRRHTDFLTVLLHELGHLWGLDHPQTITYPVMYPNWTAKQILNEDDRRGATQLYGPSTGWETALTLSWFPGYSYYEAQGIEDEILYQSQVSSPSLKPRSTEMGVTPYSGNRYLRLTGSANYPYSYAYMKEFKASGDELGSNVKHLTITNGMYLSWYQYNHIQRRMSIDIIFTDGTALRNTGLTDQNGVNVHPAARNGYATGSWYYFQVNLSSLAGKRIQDIIVAYDNGNSGETGTFRAYFDNLQISY